MSDRRLIKQVEALTEASKNMGLDAYRCLILNRDYQPLSNFPLSIGTWQDVIKGVLQDKYEVLETYPEKTIRTPNLEYPVPSIVVTKGFKNNKRKVEFSKSNVVLRDDYQCQYCDGHFKGSALTLDHVIPKSKGGRENWLNMVAACDPCNGSKGSKPLGVWRPPSGRKGPRTAPYAPTQYELSEKARKMPLIIPEGSNWENYLNWVGPLYIRNRSGSTYQISGPGHEDIGKEELGF